MAANLCVVTLLGRLSRGAGLVRSAVVALRTGRSLLPPSGGGPEAAASRRGGFVRGSSQVTNQELLVLCVEGVAFKSLLGFV